MANVLDEITIKKEIEDPEYNDHAETQDSPQGQGDNQNGQKLAKVWVDEEVKTLIELAKKFIPKCKDPNYTKKHLLDDLTHELHLLGYDKTAESVRNKMRYLRNRYRMCVIYNAKHVEKKTIPFNEELTELYSLDYFEQDGYSERNGHSNDHLPAKRTPKPQSLPASHVDLRTVVTSKRKASQVNHKNTKFVVKRRAPQKKGSQPMFQCGLCMQKFKTSQDMHGHGCKSQMKTVSDVPKKVVPSSSFPSSNNFHWNSLMTMHFLELLKEYQENYRNSHFRKANLWDHLSILMKKRGVPAPSKELEKKWGVLTSAFDKTLKYNKTHKDKKKCAFFKRLTDLHRHPISFSCFKAEEPVKMTVEVSPFSFAREATMSSSTSYQQARRASEDVPKPVGTTSSGANGVGELMLWLETTWNEWKDIEKKREALQAQRHNELLEMLSYLIESGGPNSS